MGDEYCVERISKLKDFAISAVQIIKSVSPEHQDILLDIMRRIRDLTNEVIAHIKPE